MRFLSLDPSVNNVGWTVFDSKKKDPRKQWRWGTFVLEGHNLVQRICDLKGMIDLKVGDFDHLIGEYPTFFSAERGQIAAHKGYTIDLAYILGYIAGASGKDHRTFHPFTPMQWKGAVSKEITARKFFRVFKVRLSTLSEHAIDSTMMLRHFLLTYGPKVFRAAGEDFPVTPLLRF